MGNRIYLASPTMHQEEQVFIQEAFDTNWVALWGRTWMSLKRELRNSSASSLRRR